MATADLVDCSRMLVSTNPPPAGRVPTGGVDARRCRRWPLLRPISAMAICPCGCMKHPAQLCTGYLGDIGVPVRHQSRGFQRLGRSLSRWPFGIRRATPQRSRIGRIVMGRARDAADVAEPSTAFGVANLVRVDVLTEEQVQLA